MPGNLQIEVRTREVPPDDTQPAAFVMDDRLRLQDPTQPPGAPVSESASVVEVEVLKIEYQSVEDLIGFAAGLLERAREIQRMVAEAAGITLEQVEHRVDLIVGVLQGQQA